MTQPMIGYLYNYPQGLQGTPGMAYDYILASNGIFVHAQGNLIQARMKLTDCEIRGLDPLTEQVTLVHGLVPSYLLAMAVKMMAQRQSHELYLAMVWDGARGLYQLLTPPQEGTVASVRYDVIPHTVVDLHSHGTMSARFSATDDQDDQGFRISGVIGQLHRPVAEMSLRLGIYGYRFPINYLSVFSGPMPADLIQVQT